jgi:hypothetical protein
MSDESIAARIEQLVADEHDLRAREQVDGRFAAPAGIPTPLPFATLRQSSTTGSSGGSSPRGWNARRPGDQLARRGSVITSVPAGAHS